MATTCVPNTMISWFKGIATLAAYECYGQPFYFWLLVATFPW